MRRSRLRDERGMALVLSVFALVVIGALVAGSFFVGRLEHVTGRNTLLASQAGEAAEAGVAYAMGTLDYTAYTAMPIWTPDAPIEYVIPPTTVAGAPGRVFTDSIRRLNAQVFLIRSFGQRVSGGRVLATTSVGQLMRLAKPLVGVNAAITIQDPINFNGAAINITGYNSVPDGWSGSDCAVGWPDNSQNTDDLVAVRSATTTGASTQDLDRIDGYPVDVVEFDPTITSQTFQNFLDATYATLAAQENVKLLPLETPYNGVAPVVDFTTTPPSCDKTAPFNFGEPTREVGSITQCYMYYPIVHGTGGSTKFAAGSRGQGILLVDGDLELVGDFEWSGLIIVRGKIKMTGTGNKLSGAVLAEGVDVNTGGSIGGDATILYSKCAIENAMFAAATPSPVSRGWSQIY